MTICLRLFAQRGSAALAFRAPLLQPGEEIVFDDVPDVFKRVKRTRKITNGLQSALGAGQHSFGSAEFLFFLRPLLRALAPDLSRDLPRRRFVARRVGVNQGAF